jgi:hypothetical protein
MGVCLQPAASRARRMAATRPSIMSLGATTSAPALARLTAVRASRSREGIVVHGPAVAGFDDHAAVAVAGVLAEADVGDEDQLFGGGRGFEGAQALLHDAVLVPCAGALLVLGFGQAEEQQAAEAEARGLFGLAHGFIDGEVEDAGHGADFAAHALAGAEKEGVDQVAGLDGGFAHQGPQGFAAPEAAHPRFRENSWSDCSMWYLWRWFAASAIDLRSKIASGQQIRISGRTYAAASGYCNTGLCRRQSRSPAWARANPGQPIAGSTKCLIFQLFQRLGLVGHGCLQHRNGGVDHRVFCTG